MGVTQSMVEEAKAGVGTVTTYTGVIRGVITELVSDTSILRSKLQTLLMVAVLMLLQNMSKVEV